MKEKRCIATLYGYYNDHYTMTSMWTQESQDRLMKHFGIDIRDEQYAMISQQMERQWIEKNGVCLVCDRLGYIKWDFYSGDPVWKCIYCRTVYQDDIKEKFTECKFEDLPLVLEFE